MGTCHGQLALHSKSIAWLHNIIIVVINLEQEAKRVVYSIARIS